MPLKLVGRLWEAPVHTFECCVHTPAAKECIVDSTDAWCYVKLYMAAQTELAFLLVAWF